MKLITIVIKAVLVPVVACGGLGAGVLVAEAVPVHPGIPLLLFLVGLYLYGELAICRSVYGGGLWPWIGGWRYFKSKSSALIYIIPCGFPRTLLLFENPKAIYWMFGTEPQYIRLAAAMCRERRLVPWKFDEDRSIDDYVEMLVKADGRPIWPNQECAEICGDLEHGWWPGKELESWGRRSIERATG